MKSFILAALVIILEAGFIASIAALPEASIQATPRVDVAKAGAVRPPPAPLAAPQAPARRS